MSTVTQQQELSTRSKRVLVIGDSCEDVYHYGSCERLSPEAPIPILKLKRNEVRPGMCHNVAKNLEGLGLLVDVVTQKQVIKKHRYIEEKRLIHLLRVDDERNDIDHIDIDAVKNLALQNSYDAIIISDYDKGFLSFSHCVELTNLFQGKLLFVDSKKHDLSCFERCIIKINSQEKEKVKKLPKNFELIVTHGEHGASWKEKIYPTTKTKLHDVCGAGDTFLAGLVSKYLISNDMEKAIAFANKCASISVNNFGTFVISEEDILTT
jgi:D-beta-D-heptose 7-phosphate kinase/D-beta-D-heptose 1-phosphate adenosyltransferase